MAFLIATCLLVGLIVFGVPVGFALGLAGLFSLTALVPFNMITVLAQKVVHDTVTNHAFLTVPMFLLMAEFLSAGAVTRDLMLACNRALRRIRGGMAMACIAAGTILAAASGSSTATAATITRSAYPTMRLAGYSPSLAVGSIAISGTLAMMIPPSVAFVLFGLITEHSIGKLFMAGVIPGLMTALGYIVTVSVVLWWKPELGPDREKEEELASSSERTRVWPVGLLVVVIFTSLYTGIATPTEIAAIGASGALLICLYLRRLNWGKATTAIGNTIRTTAMIMTIVISAHMFGYFISFSRVTDAMLQFVVDADMSPTSIMLAIVLIYVLLGTIMDQAAIIILTAPITTPLMVGLGYDPIWWGVIMVKTAEIGMVTPPLGLNVYVTSAASGVDLKTCFKGIAPFVVIDFLVLGLMLIFPAIPLYLAYL
ncbi:TRAP transporter large permease [Antarctobacter sp.]|uniref:TRAP transporter large permease n=1 Tax=Antarctobacter sp. TaxID=1872577 RepID=UPI003A8FC36E